MRKKFDTRYKKITDTEPEEIYYKEYVKYARDRFNKDNQEIPLNVDVSDQGSSSGPHTVHESGNNRT